MELGPLRLSEGASAGQVAGTFVMNAKSSQLVAKIEMYPF